MNDKELTRLSRFLCLILRHKPEEIGIALNLNGWADVGELIQGVKRSGRTLTREILDRIAETDEKKRYAFSEDGAKIRASQGHSLEVDLELKPVEPPEFLYHGTATRFIDSIMREGLRPHGRQYVHLSQDRKTAVDVGSRHGKPIVFVISARKMIEAGFVFYRSENGVWLTEHVPFEYLILND